MSAEPQALAPGDIQRPAAAPAPQPQREDGSAAPAEMGAEQQLALKEVDRLRGEYGKTPVEARDTLAQQISKLQRYAFGTGDKPAGFMPDAPPPPDMREYDPMAAALADAGKTITPLEREHLVTHGKVQGLTAEQATFAADFAVRAGLDRVTAKSITTRIAQHQSQGWGIGALSDADHAELGAECQRRFGSVEKAQAEAGLARAYIKHVGLTAWVEKNAGSLQYDPPTILALAFKARSLGLKAAK